jgi:hypothetical protein
MNLINVTNYIFLYEQKAYREVVAKGDVIPCVLFGMNIQILGPIVMTLMMKYNLTQ